MYWAYIPVGRRRGACMVVHPPGPAAAADGHTDRWLAVQTFVAWIVAITFAFSWYRKWGGWSSNKFTATFVLCVALPVFLVTWLGSDFSPDEHLKRVLRSRVYVLA